MTDDEFWQLLGFRIERDSDGHRLRAVALDGRWRHPLSNTELALWRMVKRLRAREAALVAALSEYAKSENWGEFWNTDDDGHTTGVIGATGVWAGPGDEPYDVAREALAADPSAPATTEERS
jgi:hypothetical protein